MSTFLIALGNGAAVTQEMLQAIRVATTTPVTVVATTDCVVLSKLASAGAVAVALPAGVNGQWFVIGDQTGDAATNNITITPNGAETINGSATYVINNNNGCVVLVYSTTNTRWNVVARFVSGVILTNPMAAAGDMIRGGTSGVATNLATGSTTGLLHGGNGATPTWSLVVNADVDAAAAIAGSKLVAATEAVAGAVTASAQNFAGIKTFYDGLKLDEAASQTTLTNYREVDDATQTISNISDTSTVSLKFTRIGRIVTMTMSTVLTAGSKGNTTNPLLSTGIPSGWRPGANLILPWRIQNNATDSMGYVQVETGGTCEWHTITDGAWTSGVNAVVYRGSATWVV